MTAAPPGAGPAPAALPQEGARFAVVVLTAMNLLNYVDRYVPAAVKPAFQKDFGLTDTESSVPMTAFVFVYMAACPLFGALADRWPRRVVIAAGVALWSAATGAAAFATGFVSFLVARALVGIGEAAYATLAPALLSDFFPPERRNRVLTLFYVAIPVGAALGFVIGGWVGERWGWRAAFLVCGLPGLLFAALALRIRAPVKGAFDADPGAPPHKWTETLRELARNRPFVLAVGGYTAVTFANGVMGEWYATFLQRSRGMPATEATSLMGAIVALSAILGTAFGGWLGERLVRVTRQPYLAVSGWTMVLAAAISVPALVVEDTRVAVVCAGAAQFFLWAYNGPINALIVNSVGSAIRARAVAVSILTIHLFGDAISPAIAGRLSDVLGRAWSDAGRGLAGAMLLVPATALVGALVWLYAWRRLPDPRPAAVSVP